VIPHQSYAKCECLCLVWRLEDLLGPVEVAVGRLPLTVVHCHLTEEAAAEGAVHVALLCPLTCLEGVAAAEVAVVEGDPRGQDLDAPEEEEGHKERYYGQVLGVAEAAVYLMMVLHG
jgi:hypothetical protein